MTKEELMKNKKFLKRCCEYSINPNTAKIYQNYILLYSSKNEVSILMDANFNVFSVDKTPNIDNELQQEFYASTAHFTYLNEKEIGQTPKFVPPFSDYTLKDLIDLSSIIDVRDCTLTVTLNKQFYKYNKSNYMKLLMYIKIIGETINNYFIYKFHMNVIGIDVPDIKDYINSIIRNINQNLNGQESIETMVENLRRAIGPSSHAGLDGDNRIREIISLLTETSDQELTLEAEILKKLIKLPNTEFSPQEKSFDEIEIWLKENDKPKKIELKRAENK